VVLAYRGLDTLVELSILFVAATAAGLVLGRSGAGSAVRDGGFILRTAADLLFPFLLLLGVYIISHGHLTPGGGFQGGVILAVAFFLPALAGSNAGLHGGTITVLEGLAGGSFILIGLLSLAGQGQFLAPMLGHGELGELFSAGSLPLLYIAVGVKVGSEMAGLMTRLLQDDQEVA
jgi:multicomponent Na+:H+ antiporter subunit B